MKLCQKIIGSGNFLRHGVQLLYISQTNRNQVPLTTSTRTQNITITHNTVDNAFAKKDLL